jgi:hypothetical protein
MNRKPTINFIFLLFLLFSFEVLASPLIPARIGGTLTVDGVQVSRMPDAGYRIKVTRVNSTDYMPIAEDGDGLNASDWYIVDIPIYDANNQPNGASIGETAIIHVYKDSKRLTVISPSKGHIIVGKSGSTTRIDLKVETAGKVSKAIP